jgi:3-oxoadipate enol-lactonase
MPAISHGEVRIHYALSGREDRDLLVLANSLGSSKTMWNNVLYALEAEYRVLRYDMPGHGASSVPPGPCTVNQLGRDVLLLLDALGAERVNFCGLSLGGLVGIWLAIYAPQRLNRLVLANTAARVGTPATWDDRIAAVRHSGMQPLATATLERWFTPQYRDSHVAEMEQIRAMIASTSPDGYCACCAVLRDADLRAGVSAIRTPSLVIACTHDPATPPSDGRALASEISGAAYVELDASHLSAWERADEFADAALTFLADGGSHNG